MGKKENFINLVSTKVLTKTENGAFQYATSGSVLLDLSFKVPSFRRDGITPEDVEKMIAVFDQDPAFALRFLCYLRDIRGGLGERRSFRTFVKRMMKHLRERLGNTRFNRFLYCIMQAGIGRWDDVVDIAFDESDQIDDDLYWVIFQQLRDDMDNVGNGRGISLLAKWLPSERSKSYTVRTRAKVLARRLFHNDPKQEFVKYRKMLTNLRNEIRIVESKMSANEWDQVVYNELPSKAGLKYRNAFLRHDNARYSKFIDEVAEGKEKVNAKALMPYEIVASMTHAMWSNGENEQKEIKQLQNLWNNLPDPKVKKNILIVRDGSGSMGQYIQGNITAQAVADAVCLYAVEKNEGPLHDKFVTFSSSPEVVDLRNCKTLADKLKKLSDFDDCSNTDIQKTFELLLSTAREYHLRQEEIPDILIVSDMEFDQIRGWEYENEDWYEPLMKSISDRWAKFGYQLPKLIFWNVNSRSNGIPLRENANGVILVSGFSAAIYNMVVSNELDPLGALLETLNTDRYDFVDELLEDDE